MIENLDANHDANHDANRHREKMAKRKSAKDKILEGKTREKGLLIVHTGKGKGKTTAAMGLVLRCLGKGFRVAIVQFIKGQWETGEKIALSRFENCRFYALGEGFTWETQDKERDIKAVRNAWQRARTLIQDGSCDLLLLDEINIALRYDYLPLDELLEALAKKPAALHVVLTGRNAPLGLIEASDLTTEMTEIKHPFRAGIRAQEGIEF